MEDFRWNPSLETCLWRICRRPTCSETLEKCLTKKNPTWRKWEGSEDGSKLKLDNLQWIRILRMSKICEFWPNLCDSFFTTMPQHLQTKRRCLRDEYLRKARTFQHDSWPATMADGEPWTMLKHLVLMVGTPQGTGETSPCRKWTLGRISTGMRRSQLQRPYPQHQRVFQCQEVLRLGRMVTDVTG